MNKQIFPAGFDELYLMSPDFQYQLKHIVDGARKMERYDKLDSLWKWALQDLAKAADRLDAMIARTQVVYFASQAEKNKV